MSDDHALPPEDEPDRWARLMPPLEREDRLALFASLDEGSRWSMNFGVMLGCSVLIAGLGLLQNSTAVVIGAMLVAPLMTPLIGTGLALVQGNFQLLRRAMQSMALGTLMSLALGVALEIVTPGTELTSEVTARGTPNILDLLIAFFAGVAAAYALARPTLSGALPGVAIAVALVPPLAAAGIASGSGDWQIASGALLLFATNLVAIVLGSSLVFRLHGIRMPENRRTARLVMERILITLGLAMVVLTAPLAYRFIEQVHRGQTKSAVITISEEIWYRLHDGVDEEEGIDFVGGLRPNSDRPEDVVLLISADRPVPAVLLADLDRIIDEGMGEDLTVKISIFEQGRIEGGVVPAVDETTINE